MYVEIFIFMYNNFFFFMKEKRWEKFRVEYVCGILDVEKDKLINSNRKILK